MFNAGIKDPYEYHHPTENKDARLWTIYSIFPRQPELSVCS
jgi:hypothetical protein